MDRHPSTCQPPMASVIHNAGYQSYSGGFVQAAYQSYLSLHQ